MNDLEIEILKAFGSKKACCRYMKWSASTLSKVVNGSRSLRGTEIQRLNKKIKAQSMEDFKRIFFDFTISKR